MTFCCTGLWTRSRVISGNAWARRPGFAPGCRRRGYFSSLLGIQTGSWVQSASYKVSTGGKQPSLGLASLPLHSAVAVYMCGPLHPHPRGPSWPVKDTPLHFRENKIILTYIVYKKLLFI